jgi:hypothetical protein
VAWSACHRLTKNTPSADVGCPLRDGTPVERQSLLKIAEQGYHPAQNAMPVNVRCTHDTQAMLAWQTSERESKGRSIDLVASKTKACASSGQDSWPEDIFRLSVRSANLGHAEAQEEGGQEDFRIRFCPPPTRSQLSDA